ncbi:hypothetical protein GCK32_014807 [Trichostrongylus colubriformis]|uniref:Uncharacterized protein n=1 Tax=Trichostrongylus colubriformis TaxID=6319 RepID=A0AAN8F2J4_TRICO
MMVKAEDKQGRDSVNPQARSYRLCAAGHMFEHEQAEDRHPLMFSFADDGCPKQCVVRVGRGLSKESYYVPRYSHRVALTPGVQALKLSVVHESLPTLIIGVIFIGVLVYLL